MKAVTRSQYGPPDILRIEEVQKPVPDDHEILVRVKAATVNRTDCAILSGKPYIMRLFTGLWKPKSNLLGTDFAGIIENTGTGVTRFKVGDRIWGFNDLGLSSHAQYMCISDKKAICMMPESFNFVQAVACAEGAHYAYHFINKVKLHAGQQVLVNGATGAIGSSLVQFAKFYGTVVTAVCQSKDFELVKSLGADRLIDHTKQDFTRDEDRYDFIFDAVGKSSFDRCKRLLKPKGVYISSEPGAWIQNPLLALITPLWGGKKVIFPVPFNIQNSLDFTSGLIASGAFKPVLDKTYALEQIAEAYRYVASGRKTGNVFLVME